MLLCSFVYLPGVIPEILFAVFSLSSLYSIRPALIAMHSSSTYPMPIFFFLLYPSPSGPCLRPQSSGNFSLFSLLPSPGCRHLYKSIRDNLGDKNYIASFCVHDNLLRGVVRAVGKAGHGFQHLPFKYLVAPENNSVVQHMAGSRKSFPSTFSCLLCSNLFTNGLSRPSVQ